MEDEAMSTEQPAVDVPAHVLEYLSQQSTLTLATASPTGVPRASTFLYVNDGPNLFFWTRPDTTTARQIEQNPVVSFAIDEYAQDLGQTKGVQGSGECSVILSGEQIARVADLFGQKFPDLSPGATLSISFFRIAPTELEFIDNADAGADADEGTFGAEFHRESSFSIYADLPEFNPDTLTATLQWTTAEPGEVIARQGAPADKFFIVVEGELEVVRGAQGGSDGEVVSRLGPGDLFGEMAIIRDRPRTATVRAAAPTRLLAMEHDTFRELVAHALGTTVEFDKVIRARLESLGTGR
jgi:uncharacterized protein YhbP (UPF0306 family)